MSVQVQALMNIQCVQYFNRLHILGRTWLSVFTRIQGRPQGGGNWGILPQAPA